MYQSLLLAVMTSCILRASEIYQVVYFECILNGQRQHEMLNTKDLFDKIKVMLDCYEDESIKKIIHVKMEADIAYRGKQMVCSQQADRIVDIEFMVGDAVGRDEILNISGLRYVVSKMGDTYFTKNMIREIADCVEITALHSMQWNCRRMRNGL